MNQAFLRVYVNCEDQEQATTLAALIESALVVYDPVQRIAPRPYWKIPELFEFTFDLASRTRDIWADLISASSCTWTVQEDEHDRSAVWNRRHDQVFLIPSAQWAELATHA